LGLAYDRVGRTEEARALLSQTLEDYAPDPKSQEIYDLRGIWGWFLLNHGETAEASAIFDSIIRDEAKMRTLSVSPALAWAGRARLSLKREDIARAFEAYDRVTALHDTRTRATLLLTRSAVLLAAGDRTGARRDAAAALDAAKRTDVPDSPSIRQAQEALEIATAGTE